MTSIGGQVVIAPRSYRQEFREERLRITIGRENLGHWQNNLNDCFRKVDGTQFESNAEDRALFSRLLIKQGYGTLHTREGEPLENVNLVTAMTDALFVEEGKELSVFRREDPSYLQFLYDGLSEVWPTYREYDARQFAQLCAKAPSTNEMRWHVFVQHKAEIGEALTSLLQSIPTEIQIPAVDTKVKGYKGITMSTRIEDGNGIVSFWFTGQPPEFKADYRTEGDPFTEERNFFRGEQQMIFSMSELEDVMRKK